MNKIFLMVICAAGAKSMLAQPNYCMQETVVGTYAFATQGTMIVVSGGSQVAVPGAGLAVVAIDAEGAMSAAGYQSMAGQITKSTNQGTIRVNSDCTATLDWGQGVTGAAVIIDEGKELNSIMLTAGPLGKAVITGDWKRISRVPNTVVSEQCAPNAISGAYAFRESGIVMMALPGAPQPAPVPTAMLGTGSAYGDGTEAAAATGSMGGQMVPFGIATTSNLKVNPDCTATLGFNLSSQGKTMGQTQHFAVVLDGGNEIWGLEIQDSLGSPVTLATWTRVSTMPAAK